MATCEMCGEDGDLTETRVEGARLDLCEDCRDVGETVDTSTKTGASATGGSRPQSAAPSEELAPDYGDRVKRAREDAGKSVKELAEELKEKASVVKRVEAESLTPDRKLARRFERALDVALYETPSAAETTAPSQDGGSGGEQTIGDVADVRRKEE